MLKHKIDSSRFIIEPYVPKIIRPCHLCHQFKLKRALLGHCEYQPVYIRHKHNPDTDEHILIVRCLKPEGITIANLEHKLKIIKEDMDKCV